MPRVPHTLLTAAEFAALADRLEPSGLSDPAAVLAAAGLVREGRVVSAGDQPAAPALPEGAAATPGVPAAYRLTQWTESGSDWSAVNDRLEIDVHGATSMTHLDTTEHFSWSTRAARERSSDGELVGLAAAGLVGRGIHIDIPGVLGVDMTGQVATLADVQEVLRRTGSQPRPGDTLYFSFGRTGVADSSQQLGSSPTSGLSIECAEWVSSVHPTAIVTDEGLDGAPSEVEGQPVPWHLLVLTVLGIPLIDRAMLATLSSTCRELGRWEFMSVLAPLPIPRASGSPLNPLAIF